MIDASTDKTPLSEGAKFSGEPDRDAGKTESISPNGIANFGKTDPAPEVGDGKVFPIYGCHVDLAEGEQPDECVLSFGAPQDCIYATRRKVPHTCKYWRRIVAQQDTSHAD